MKFYQDNIFDFDKNCVISSSYIESIKTKIYFIDNVYLYPDKVYEYWNSFPIKSHKTTDGNSLNGKNFFDGRSKSELPLENYKNLLEYNVHNLVDRLYGYSHPENLRDSRSVNQFYLLDDVPPRKVWWPHVDYDRQNRSIVNVLTYLNPQVKNGPGTSLYIPKKNYKPYGEEHTNPWLNEDMFEHILSIFGYYNRMVLFPGSVMHGMTGSNIFKNFVRIVGVQFV